MSDQSPASGGTNPGTNPSGEKSTRPMEMPAVKTTIVGGRPPGSGKMLGAIPRGIEVLVKKAVVDAEFRAMLLTRRAKAADEIGLILTPEETLMLNHVPAAQLEAIIARTRVDPTRWNAFLSKAAGVMLAALGASALVSETDAAISKGVQPDKPPTTASAPASKPASGPAYEPLTRGVRPDIPAGLVSPGRDANVSAAAGFGGVRPDNIPAPTGIRPDIPKTQPASGPTSQPASHIAPPENVMPAAGVREPGLKAAPRFLGPPVQVNEAAPADQPAVAPAPARFQGGMRVAGIVVGPIKEGTDTQPAASQPASQPGRPVQAPVVVGDRIDRPQLVAGVRAVEPPPPAPTGQPAPVPVSQPTLGEAKIAELIQRLDADDYKAREAASTALKGQGPGLLPRLRDELKKTDLTAESRSRLESLVRVFTAMTQPAQPVRPDNIGARRGVRVLETDN